MSVTASEPIAHGDNPLDRLNELISTTEAAALAGVTVAAVSNWRDRGILPAAGTDERGRPLYRFIDVAKAERATRDKARRTR